MPKRKIKVIIQNEEQTKEEELIALFQKETIHYIEKDGTHTSYDKKKNQLRRKNEQLEMEYIFVEGETSVGSLVIKDLHKKLEIPIITKKIIIKEHTIEIRYTINEEEYKYRIEEII